MGGLWTPVGPQNDARPAKHGIGPNPAQARLTLCFLELPCYQKHNEIAPMITLPCHRLSLLRERHRLFESSASAVGLAKYPSVSLPKPSGPLSMRPVSCKRLDPGFVALESHFLPACCFPPIGEIRLGTALDRTSAIVERLPPPKGRSSLPPVCPA